MSLAPEPPAPRGAAVRPFLASDAEAVAALEALCNPQPWRAEDLMPFATGAGDEPSSFARLGEVALDGGGKPVGYVFASLVAGEGELLLLGVHPEARRRGVAKALLDALFKRLKEREAHSVFLEVRCGNVGAIRLYEGQGFAPIGARAGYYADNGEDALLFRKEL